MIKKIIQWSNGIVMVFDHKGEQMPEHQGKRVDVIEDLRRADLSEAVFEIGSWMTGTVPSSREQFFSNGWG